MDWYLIVCAGVFGLIIGSFLNVVILRFNSGKTLWGRSQCLVCSHELTALELVPVASFLVLQGKCSRCKTKISPQYVLVEAITGILFAFIAARILTGFSLSAFSLALFLVEAAFWSVLVAIAAYDLRHKIIPDLFSALVALSALGLVLIRYADGGNAEEVGSHIIAAFVLSFFILFLWLITRGRGMGFGDVKLVFGLGLYLGLPQGVSALAFAFWIGAGYALSLITFQHIKRLLGTKRLSPSSETLTMKSKVPFAPFLIAGTLLASLLQSDIFHLTLLFNG